MNQSKQKVKKICECVSVYVCVCVCVCVCYRNKEKSILPTWQKCSSGYIWLWLIFAYVLCLAHVLLV